MNSQRDFTRQRKLDVDLRKYRPCPCGSGKKFKFCCLEVTKTLQRRFSKPPMPGTNSYI